MSWKGNSDLFYSSRIIDMLLRAEIEPRFVGACDFSRGDERNIPRLV